MPIAVVLSPWLPPPLLLLAATVLVVLTAGAAWRTRRSASAWVVWSAFILRLLAIACLCLLVLRPESVRLEQTEKQHSLVLLVDDTQSMLLRDTELGPTRAEEGQEAFQRFMEGATARHWDVKAYDAGENLALRHAGDVRFRGRAPSSPLGERLAEVVGFERQDPRDSEPCAGILFSDGGVNRGRSLADAAREWHDRGIPLFAVVLGHPRESRPDAQLSGLIIRCGESRSPADPIRAGSRLAVEAQGTLLPGGPRLSGPLADATARLFVAGPLTDQGAEFKETESLRHRLPTSPAWTPVRLPFTPRQPGLYRVRLAIDPVEGERNLTNNIVYGSFEVIPPQRRILYIASRLGHDYRAMRDLFVDWSGPPVEIVADFVTTRQEGAPKIGGVADEVLAQWLGEGVPDAQRGGAVVWEEPDFSRVRPSTQAKMRAALQSGALSVAWILNEDAAALRRRLHGSPLEDAFLFSRFDPPATAPRPGGIASEAPARTHPITQGFLTGHGTRDPFSGLPALTAWGDFGGAREGTMLLLRAGTRPLLSVGQVGQGRVAVMATGESWRWLAPLHRSSQTPVSRDIAERLYLGLVEWLSDSSPRADPPVRLYLPKDEWILGEKLRARVVARMADPRQGLQVEFDLANLSAGVAPPPRWQKWAGDVSEPEGAWDASLPLDSNRGRLRAYAGVAGQLERAGEWLLRVRGLLPDGRELGQDQLQFVVRGAPLEERSEGPDRTGLQRAVESAGLRGEKQGALIEPRAEDIASLLDRLAPWMQPETIVRETRAPVVSMGGLLGLLILSLLVDIWLRRG